MVLLLFAGAYKRQVHIPLPDAAQAAVTILRGDESAWNGEVAEERCLVWSCRIPLIFRPELPGVVYVYSFFENERISKSLPTFLKVESDGSGLFLGLS